MEKNVFSSESMAFPLPGDSIVALFSGKPLVGYIFCCPWGFFEGLRIFLRLQWIWALFGVQTHFTPLDLPNSFLEKSWEIHEVSPHSSWWSILEASFASKLASISTFMLPREVAHWDQAQKNWLYFAHLVCVSTFFDVLDNLVPRNRGSISHNQGAISRNRGAIQKVYGHYWHLPPKCRYSIA